MECVTKLMKKKAEILILISRKNLGKGITITNNYFWQIKIYISQVLKEYCHIELDKAKAIRNTNKNKWACTKIFFSQPKPTKMK